MLNFIFIIYIQFHFSNFILGSLNSRLKFINFFNNLIGFNFPNSSSSFTSESYGLNLNLSWELDLWGKLKDGHTASEAEWAASVEDYEAASKIITEFMNEKKFGEAGNKIVIEEFLTGQEVSFIVMVNGEEILPLATSQDHKTIGECDKGLNTGGMGAYSPVPFMNEKLNEKIIDNIIRPTVKGLASEGIHFRGFLYAGLMIDENLEAKVLEYNCRFGDPETQPIMMRLESDLYDLIDSCFKGGLDKFPIEWNSDMALGVSMSSQGYPESYETGIEITGLEDLNCNNLKVFHSGTKKENNNNPPERICA